MASINGAISQFVLNNRDWLYPKLTLMNDILFFKFIFLNPRGFGVLGFWGFGDGRQAEQRIVTKTSSGCGPGA